MNHVIKILCALAEPSRFAAMQILWDGKERCICELMKTLNKGQSTVSRHMITLKKANLVISRRDAQWVRYRRNPALHEKVVNLVDAAFRIAGKKKDSSPQRVNQKTIRTLPSQTEKGLKK